MPKNIKLSDIRKEAQKLIESGKMPPLHQLLGAVAYARQQYTPRIRAAQASGPEPEEGAPVDFGGRVLSNPKGIKPEWDTEHRAQPQSFAGGAQGSIDNAPLTPPPGDINNAEPTNRQSFPEPQDIER